MATSHKRMGVDKLKHVFPPHNLLKARGKLRNRSRIEAEENRKASAARSSTCCSLAIAKGPETIEAAAS